MKLVNIIQGDARRIPLPDRSVDLIFCSPPYEDCRLYGQLNYKLSGQAWVDWAVERFLECMRVSRGAVCWVVEGRTSKFRWTATPALFMADLHRRGVHLRKPPIYARNGIPGSGGPDWLRNDYEFIVCATSGGKLPWSDNVACGHPPIYDTGGACSNRLTNGNRANRDAFGFHRYGGRGRKADGTPKKVKAICCTRGISGGDLQTQAKYAHPKIVNPGNIIQCKVGGGLMGHDLAHENEAPFALTLAEFFIKSFCPPGGLVLDPFCGSGTTLHAAVIHGRRGIGMDIRADQCDLARRRLEDVISKIPSDKSQETAA